ncbi:MAG: hypothetical protein H6Q88_3658, partial [Anaeromyxobacteraceae bacterium]|nr:hypothetical protein [Anaeromyxobacteraceae bacterium]
MTARDAILAAIRASGADPVPAPPHPAP